MRRLIDSLILRRKDCGVHFVVTAHRVTIAGAPQGSGLAYHFTLVDGGGELDVLFPGWAQPAGLQPSTRIAADGTVGSYDGKLALWNPSYAIVPVSGRRSTA